MWDSPCTAQQLGMLTALGARIMLSMSLPPVRMQEIVLFQVRMGLPGARRVPPVRWPPVRMQEACKPTCACGTARYGAAAGVLTALGARHAPRALGPVCRVGRVFLSVK